MKKLLCLLCCLFLVGCEVQAPPPRPAMRFDQAPVTLTQDGLVLRGTLTFAGVDGLRLVLESPEAVRGFVYTLAQGELHIARGDVTVPAENTGCIAAFLQAVRAFDLEEAAYADGVWQLAGEAVFLTTDENGTVLRLWGKEWQAEFN